MGFWDAIDAGLKAADKGARQFDDWCEKRDNERGFETPKQGVRYSWDSKGQSWGRRKDSSQGRR